ncbi:hypothetical protein IWW48_003478 [Coemansia sp. RSA 1200]|nr:hypothetical protein IWW48_003478 [Coemansia sp. RSA 1200]
MDTANFLGTARYYTRLYNNAASTDAAPIYLALATAATDVADAKEALLSLHRKRDNVEAQLARYISRKEVIEDSADRNTQNTGGPAAVLASIDSTIGILSRQLEQITPEIKMVMDEIKHSKSTYYSLLSDYRNRTSSLPRIASGLQVASGVFAPFALPGGSGRFIPNTNQNANAPRNIRILLAEGLFSSAWEFQRRMELNVGLMAARFELPSFQLGHSEDHLARYICRWFGPRLAALLKPTPGVVSVELEMGSLRDGADLFLSIHDRGVLGPVLRMPIEVKTAFGQHQRPTSGLLEAGMEVQNLHAIAEASGRGFSPRHVLNGVLQTSMYAAAHSGSGNHGILISSECLFLVRNSTPVSVDVSEAIPLVGGELHPAAAIAWWAQRALSYPQPHIPTMGRAVPQAAVRIPAPSTSGRPPSGPSTPGPTTRAMARRSGPTPASDTRPAKRRHTEAEGSLQQPQGHGASAGTSKAVAAQGLIPTLPSPDSPLAKKLRRVDRAGSFAKYVSFEGVNMQFLAEYRSGAVYRCSLSGQDTVVKTADPDKSWLVAELCNEVEAYKRLGALQGICIPRIFSTGHSVISGEDACFIAMEFLGDPSIHYGEDTEEAHANALCALDQRIKNQFFGILRMIHRRDVAHCDIRAANLLYAQTRPGGLQTPFIIDFGLAAVGNATEEQKRNDMVLLREALGGFE